MTKKSDELTHFGIKGQKWGIRRYQNQDGTLTAAGKAKYKKYVSAASKSLDERRHAYGKINEAMMWRETHPRYLRNMREMAYSEYVNNPKMDIYTSKNALSYRKQKRYEKKIKSFQKKLNMTLDEAWKSLGEEGKKYSDIYDFLK